MEEGGSRAPRVVDELFILYCLELDFRGELELRKTGPSVPLSYWREELLPRRGNVFVGYPDASLFDPW